MRRHKDTTGTIAQDKIGIDFHILIEIGLDPLGGATSPFLRFYEYYRIVCTPYIYRNGLILNAYPLSFIHTQRPAHHTL